ncbi:MFS transporter [Mycoplasma putrefaciens]|uniref:Permease n=1 Tax=Mycoplasma putrefaciens Mput9231 TaxID=1292033 RepID=M9WCF4_9MOLU|nr:MFS transporter [Mycoplasma putrefaciens]AGJ90491.1 Hypothetical protein, putative permease, predicted transmembrane protein [Mycoplasma putrefaciens Mput9231]
MKQEKSLFAKLKNLIKENFTLFILALADLSIMAIPFYMDNFIPNINANFKLPQADYSQAGAIYGFVSLPCYLIGAWLGDKFRSKSLIMAGIGITGLLGIWYIFVPFIPYFAGVTDQQITGEILIAVRTQLFVIYGGFAFATCALFWAPLWKLVKNQNVDHLPEELKEKKVGKNNGIQGMLNGLMGLLIALFGTLLFYLSKEDGGTAILGKVAGVNISFLILISIYTSLIIISLILTLFFIHEPKTKEPPTFSFKSIIDVLKEKTVVLLAILILGVYMLQMGLSSYINYLKNIFLVPTVIVGIVGTFRTYAMRFLIAGWFGRYADKKKSYIPLICIALAIGMVLVAVAIVLPELNPNQKFDDNSAVSIILQVAACLNLILLGAVTWAAVTIRWSPIGTDLGIENHNYAAAVNIISVIAFSPDAFFKQIRSAIERNHHMNLNDGTQVADKLGNQLILVTVLVFAAIGLAAGIGLHFILKKRRDQIEMVELVQIQKST